MNLSLVQRHKNCKRKESGTGDWNQRHVSTVRHIQALDYAEIAKFDRESSKVKVILQPATTQ